MLQVGELVGDAYKVESLLGQGGMGFVFRARHTTMGQEYALKIVNPDVLDAVSVKRFAIEAQSIARLNHLNIVKIFNMGVHNQTCPYYVMELMSGDSLSAYIKKGIDISLEQGLDIFSQMASALGYAHSKGIVHRDVKPSNIILLPLKNSYQAKIVDFGLAKVQAAGQQLTATGEVFGTPYYMSPERCTGQPIDGRADIYSLGCALFETITGAPPFKGATAVETLMMQLEAPTPKLVDIFEDPEKGQQFDLLLGRMMAKRLDDRYQTMEQVSHDIQRLIERKSIDRSAVETQGDQTAQGGCSDADAKSAASEQLWRKVAIGAVLFSLVAFAVLLGFSTFQVVRQWVLEHDPAKKIVDKGMLDTPLPREADLAQPVTDSKPTIEMFSTLSPIKASLVKKADGVYKQFKFPDLCLGEIWDARNIGTPAKGVTEVANTDLALNLVKKDHRVVFDVPQVLSSIGVDEFVELRLKLGRFDDIDDKVPKNTLDDRLVQILQIVQKWTKLRALVLDNFNETKPLVDEIARLNSLQEFSWSHCGGDTTVLTSAPFLLRLNSLTVDQPEPSDMSRLIRAVAASSKLEFLNLRDLDVDDDAFSQLAKCTSLRSLFSCRMKVSKRMLQAIVDSKNLTFLSITFSDLSPDDLIFLSRSKHIKNIVIASVGCSAEQLASLTKKIPHLKVVLAPPVR